MAEQLEIEDCSLTQRVILLGIVRLAGRGETPADSVAVKEAVTEQLDRIDAEVLGRMSEADIMRAMNQLGSSPLIDEVTADDTSPVGKGRPSYELGVDPEAVLEALSSDDRLTPLIREIDG